MRFLLLLLLLTACKSIPQQSFEESKKGIAPDYSNLEYWAAAPQKKDNADKTPGSYENMQEEAKADVFFLHPTSYTRERGNTEWNGVLSDEKLNEKTDEGAILYQASVFNGAARVYAPRYRQAHIFVYYTKSEDYNPKAAKRALELAYEDVKTAFEYYLENWNDGRPIIIASHSQGTTHATRLMKDYFDGKPLQEKLVAAYLLGMPVRESEYEHIKPCENAKDTGCTISWRAYEHGHLPTKWKDPADDILVTNPLSWRTDTTYMSKESNLGTVLYNFDKVYDPGLADAQKHKGHLWVTRPKFRGSFLVQTKNYHAGDYNLFYGNVRANAAERVQAYLERENL